MAIFRKVHVQFWSDVFIQSLTPEQKFFFLYLLTNERTKQCGIYEITTRQISYDTGYNVETVLKLIDFLTANGKIVYSKETNEVAVKNWVKYNDQTSPSVKACIQKELMAVKSSELIIWAGYNIPISYKINPNNRVGVLMKTKVFDKYGNKCQKCKSSESLSIDHIIPTIIGGQSIEENLRCLCRSCNSSRPVMGIDLIKEVTDCGFDFQYLYTLSTGLRQYEHSVRSMPKEEEEQEREQEREPEREVEEEIGSDKVKIIANSVWNDQFWKESVCMALSISMEELKKWLAMFNASVSGDNIRNFDKLKYKKMSRGWISMQQAKGTKVDISGVSKKSDAAPLTILSPK